MTTKTTTPKTLVEKLLAVREAVGGYVQKTGRNSAQGYNFASEAAITEKIYPAFAEEGVLFYPESRRVIDQGVLEYTTSKGGKMLMTTTETKWVATDGVDRIEVMTIGQGADSGDKGAYKGMAGDKKYAILQLLGIATGDDPEETRADEKDEAKPAAKAKPAAAKPAAPKDDDPATDEMKAEMVEAAKSVGIDLTTDEGRVTIQAIVLLATGKKSSRDLTVADMPKVMKALAEAEPQAVAA